LQIAYEVYRISITEDFAPWLRAAFIFCLCGGVVGSQVWSFKVSKRLVTKYRPAFHTKPTGVGASPIAFNPPKVASVDGSLVEENGANGKKKD
jgi:hypothetical protein